MKTVLALAALLALALPSPAAAQVDVRIHLGLPVAPPLVVVQPGVQVVEDHDDEVFVHSGWYWVRRPPHWYRARGPTAAFVLVEPRHVPAPLVRLPPGRYRHWRGDARHEHHDHASADRYAWKEQEKAERRQAKAARKAHRRAEKEQRHEDRHGHGQHRD